MRVLWLTFLLLLSHPCNAKSFDLDFTGGLIHSYLCTGKTSWWKQIRGEYDALRYMMHAAVIVICQGEITENDVKIIVTEARQMVQNQKQEKRTEVSKCLWSGIKSWNFVPFFCPLPSEKFMENFDSTLDFIIQSIICSDKIEGPWSWKIGCLLAKLVMENRHVIRKAVHPYLCKKRLQKRQYDLASVMKVFEQSACLKSSSFNFNFVAIEEGHNLYFTVYGFWCCIIKFLPT